MTPEELQEIKDRCINVKQVKFSCDFIGDNCVIQIGDNMDDVIVVDRYFAELISHAHSDIPALLAEVERLQAALERLADQENYSNSYPDAIRDDIELWWSNTLWSSTKWGTPWDYARSILNK